MILDIIVKAENGGIKIPDNYRETFNKLIEYCDKKRGGFMRVKLSPPFKHRSTGEKSMNHHINGHVTQIAMETGEDHRRIKEEAKEWAVKRGYPTRTDKFGKQVPLSETEIDDTQAGYLVEALHEVAAFCGVVLQEE